MLNKDSKIAIVPAPNDIIVHFHKQHPGFGTSNFVFYDAVTNYSIAMNTKLNVTMEFDARRVKDLLQAFLRLPDAGAFEKLVHEDHQNRGLIDYHGAPKSAHLNAMQLDKPLIYGGFVDDEGDRYTLLEVGVFICLDKSHAVTQFNTEEKASIEVKFAKVGSTNNRMIVNIHLVHNQHEHNVPLGVKCLDDLVGRLHKPTMKRAMTICKKIDNYNYYKQGYRVHRKSSEYHAEVCKKMGGTRHTFFERPKTPDCSSMSEFPSLS